MATRFDLDWGRTWDNVRQMNPWLYVLALALYYLSFVFRGVRWRMLAHSASDGRSADGLPSMLRSSQLILIGWFVNAIAWLRLGDAYRAYMFAEESKRGFAWSLGTIVAERAIDMASIFLLLAAAALLFSASTDSSTARYLLLAAFLMAFVLVVVLLTMKHSGVRLARLLPRRLESAYQRFHQGTLGSFRNLPVLFVLSAGAWLLEASRLYVVTRALDMDVGLPLVMVAALGHAILSTVPTPGGVGAVEPGLTGLLALSLERSDAASVALVDRSITYLSVIVFGGLALLLRQVWRARKSAREHIATGRDATPE